MRTRKEILARAAKARTDGELELAGLLEDYVRLRDSYVPQLLRHFVPASGGSYFPHMSKPKHDADLELYPKGFVRWMAEELHLGLVSEGDPVEHLIKEYKNLIKSEDGETL